MSAIHMPATAAEFVAQVLSVTGLNAIQTEILKRALSNADYLFGAPDLRRLAEALDETDSRAAELLGEVSIAVVLEGVKLGRPELLLQAIISAQETLFQTLNADQARTAGFDVLRNFKP